MFRDRAGSQKKWAKKNGVTPSLISMVLSGDRPLNNKIISALKLRRVVVYERLDRTAGRPSAPTRRVGSYGPGLAMTRWAAGNDRLTNAAACRLVRYPPIHKE